MRSFLLRSVVTLWLVNCNTAFQSSPTRLSSTVVPTTNSKNDAPCVFGDVTSPTTNTIVCAMHRNGESSGTEDENNSPEDVPAHRRRRGQQLVSKIKMSLAFLSPIVLASSSVALVATVAPQKAHAGAPVMAMPKMKTPDPTQVAMDLHEKKLMQEAQKELSDYQSKARAVEKEKGAAAREQFESDYKESQKQKAVDFKEGLVELKRNLLDEGIDPNQDIEGKRQCIFYVRGVDLGTVAGTKFNVETRYEAQGSDQSFAVQKKSNREMIKAMVQDLKNRDIDPVIYFERNQEKTDIILKLPGDKAAVLAEKYNTNLELYGQIALPKEGEKSVKELMAEKGQNQNQKGSKEEQKRMKAEAKEKAAAEKAEAKSKAKAEKERLKEEKQAAKEEAKMEKEATKAAAIAGTAAATAAAAAAAAVSAPTDFVGSVDTSTPPANIDGSVEAAIIDDSADEDVVATTDSGSTAVSEKKKSGGIKIIPASAVVVTVGGGAYALKMVRDRSANEEEERQRQFKLLMGEVEKGNSGDSVGSAAASAMSDLMAEYDDLTEEDDEDDDVKSPEPIESSTPTAPMAKKRRGLKAVFGKKKNGREIDIAALVSPEAKDSEFSKTLAKILTFGAPGRFPEVMKLPGAMPLDTFDLDKASNILIEAQDTAGITKEESAEIFANVVNCMLIDIVDLASTSLKEKDEKVTIDALGIVITFMDLAAQLYTSIADGVDIVPVTYGGDISKGKLEQMYSTYAASGMMDMASMDEKFDDRVSLLQDVFQISPKKAEGLMTKAMQKNMMEMMKSGNMPDGMEDMMKGMEGMPGMDGGMPGMGMDGEEPDPEQLKEMLRALKEMKDSGSIPESELAEVKKQFKESFGSNIDEVMKGASDSGEELGQQDQELLDLMKSILD
jgi:hypothetical protein